MADGTAGKARRVRSSSTNEPSPGAPLGDVWEIGIIGPGSKERTGYPTQKPEALLERLILATTNPGDFVLDPFCGSGTTLAVCQRLGRSVVGIDSSDVAIRIARGRSGSLARGDLGQRDLKACQ
jgi:site-specific DNA-methyltransferase (adenine-specific)